MKNMFLSLFSLMLFASISSAQVFFKPAPSKDVNASTWDYRFTANAFEAQVLGDGKNVRGAFNIGTGVNLNSLVANLPPVVKDFRVVPFVTVDASASGLAPRATFALLAPQWNISPNFGFQVGAALRGVDAKNDWRPVYGVDPYLKLSVYYK